MIAAADVSPALKKTADAVLFRASGLCKNFGGVRAVRDISFKIAPGIVFAVIGPNGAGKSTLLNLMSGIYQPDAGTMSLAEVDLVGMSPRRRVRLKIQSSRALRKIEATQKLNHLRRRRG